MQRRIQLTILLGIILLGTFLRLYQLDAVAFRGDEAFSVQRWAQEPLSTSLTEIAAIEPHPPLTYILFRAWGLIFGTESEFILRLLPVLFNLLGIPTIYALGKRLSGLSSIGLIAAFLWAIHPFQIWHAQDFRNYGIWAGLSVITLWLGLRVIHSDRRLISWILYIFVATLSSLVFYNELITIGVLGLYVIIISWHEKLFIFKWSVINAAIIALTITIFIIFQGNLITGGGYGGTTGGFEIVQWWQRFIPVLNFGDTLSLSLQQQFNPTTIWWWFIVGIVLISTGFVIYKVPQQSIFLVMVAFLPLLVLGIISTQLRIFRPRYIILAAPAYTLIISYSVVLLWQMSRTRILSIILLAVWLGISGISLNNYYHNPAFAKAPDWVGLIQYLEDNTEANEVIIQTSVDASFGYYYDNSEIDAGEFGLPANVTQPIDKVIHTMEMTAHDYHSFWIIGQTFPDWPNAGVVEDWAFENLQLVRETNIDGSPIRQFMSWEIVEEEVQITRLATYDEAIQLVGTQIFNPEPSNELTIWLYWHPIQQTDSALTAFVHLVGDINPSTGTALWSQDDHLPQNGRVSTDSWEIGQTYRDVYILPLAEVISGEYSIQVGFYDAETGDRLTLEDGTDNYVIGNVVIE